MLAKVDIGKPPLAEQADEAIVAELLAYAISHPCLRF
jgi:hypothetical protein